MKHSVNAKTILKHFLSLISNGTLLTGILLMIGAIGSMDMAVETGGSGIDLNTMLIGFVLTMIGFTLAHRREKSGKRKIIREQDKTVYRVSGRMAG